jgi:hypothetical protein
MNIIPVEAMDLAYTIAFVEGHFEIVKLLLKDSRVQPSANISIVAIIYSPAEYSC